MTQHKIVNLGEEFFSLASKNSPFYFFVTLLHIKLLLKLQQEELWQLSKYESVKLLSLPNGVNLKFYYCQYFCFNF